MLTFILLETTLAQINFVPHFFRKQFSQSHLYVANSEMLEGDQSDENAFRHKTLNTIFLINVPNSSWHSGHIFILGSLNIPLIKRLLNETEIHERSIDC